MVPHERVDVSLYIFGDTSPRGVNVSVGNILSHRVVAPHYTREINNNPAHVIHICEMGRSLRWEARTSHCRSQTGLRSYEEVVQTQLLQIRSDNDRSTVNTAATINIFIN